jgi:hypothetical protein
MRVLGDGICTRAATAEGAWKIPRTRFDFLRVNYTVEILHDHFAENCGSNFLPAVQQYCFLNINYINALLCSVVLYFVIFMEKLKLCQPSLKELPLMDLYLV